VARVIGAKEVDELAEGATLTVPSDAIITPLARDIIREKRLRVISVQAESQAVSAERARENEAAEEALSHLSDRAKDYQEQSSSSEDDRPQAQNTDDQIEQLVETAVRQVLAQQQLQKVQGDAAIKLAVFGVDAPLLLRSLLEVVEGCGGRVSKLSGHEVSGVFVLAVAVIAEKMPDQETRKALQEGLSNSQIPFVIQDS